MAIRSRWWRAYDEALHDPKVQMLEPPLFKTWFNLLCIASKNDGVLPSLDAISFDLRISKHKAAEAITALTDVGLIDKRDDDQFEPHNWGSRQYQSDASRDRVKRHREKRTAAGLQSQWTAPKALRQAIYKRDNFRCVYCGSDEKLSLDHRIPEFRGGTHAKENLATACMACNGSKRDLTEEEFRFRNGQSNVSVTLHETSQKRPQTTEAEAEQKESERPRKRGSRLEREWWPSTSEVDYALAKGLDLDHVNIEAQKFRNYWTAKAGAGATKLDWTATWQNWILNAKESRNGQAKPDIIERGRRLADRARELERQYAADFKPADDPTGSH
jgi:5-methylcytosine-specific restriction endonuclease McrA